MNILFAAAIVFVWGWFHLAPKPPKRRVYFRPRPAIQRYRFVENPLEPGVYKTLQTTQIFNGTFSPSLAGGGNEERAATLRDHSFRVFLANWTNSPDLSVLGHTPDICWTGIGWQPVSANVPSMVELNIRGERASFDCRAFQQSERGPRELALWCLIVDGEPSAAGLDVARGGESAWRFSMRERWARVGEIIRLAKERRPVRGPKQFIRFSVAVEDDWAEALEQLRRFASEWLEPESQ